MFTNYRYYTNNKDIVVAVSSYAGKPVKGIAKCSTDDEFDLEKGKKLASARCNLKVSQLRYERALNKHKAVYDELDVLDVKIKDANDYLDNSWKALWDAQNIVKKLESKF